VQRDRDDLRQERQRHHEHFSGFATGGSYDAT
jgi:hypothetical protein